MEYVRIHRWVCLRRLVASATFMIVSAGQSFALTTIFDDAEFPTSAWIAVKALDTTFGQQGTVSAVQLLSGGNPDAFRLMEHNHTTGQLGVAHLFSGAIYDPSIRGPISSVSYAFDIRALSLGSTAGILFRPLLYQNGSFFTVNLTNLVSQTNMWVTRAHTGLVASSFCKIGNCFVKPDFSATGSVIQFGFFSYTSSPGPTNRSEFAIDNWSVSIQSTAPVRFVSFAIDAGMASVSWLSDTGAAYQLQKFIAPTGAWLDLGSPVAGNDQAMSQTDSADSDSAWYRLIRLEP